jgi:hypothetical protein
MTRAGERLYGEWERRCRPSVGWGAILRTSALLVAAAGLWWVALFGFAG